jgi:late competence protein required for DNA uptake (superfamily II DNA/RNA helicase)
MTQIIKIQNREKKFVMAVGGMTKNDLLFYRVKCLKQSLPAPRVLIAQTPRRSVCVALSLPAVLAAAVGSPQ